MGSSFGTAQPPSAIDLIGRDRERETLRNLLERIPDGGRLAIVTGPAGIGKSTLVRETLGMARERGYSTFIGACYSGLTTAPYEPWHDALTPRPGVGATPAHNLKSYLESCLLKMLR